MSKSVREQIANRCTHFNGVQHDTCRAGCSYKQFQGKQTLPCLRSQDLDQSVKCDKRQWVSEEEIQKELDEIELEMKKFMTAGPLIKRIKREHRGEDWKGVEECPVCKGKLHMSHAKYNGHVWGKCETKDCLAWME